MKRRPPYPVTPTEIKTFISCCGSQQVSINNAFFGQIPERILIALVKNTAFVGSASTNLFHFHLYDMRNLVLYLHGVQHPPDPHTMGYSSPFGATRAYEILFSSTGIHHDGNAHMINLDISTNGFHVLGFDLIRVRQRTKTFEPPRQGNMRYGSNKTLPEHITSILYAEFPGDIEIDNSRNVTLEWIPFGSIKL